MTFRLTSIQDSVVSKQDYIALAKHCADVCTSLDRGLDERRLDELGRSVLGAIEQLTT